MKLTIDTDQLSDAAQWALRAVPGNPPIPVMAGTQLRTDRILDEAAATAGDPLHLATVFGMSTGAAVRYADAVRETSASRL